MSLHWPILKRLVSRPMRRGLLDERRAWRGVDTLIASARAADAIANAGAAPVVATMLPTGGAAAGVMLGAWSLGRAVAPLNFLLNPLELDKVLRHCGADVVVTARPILERLGWTPQGVRTVYAEDALLSGFPAPRIPKGASDADLAALLYTSGTSGAPKGVMLTHGNITANIQQMTARVEFSAADTLCASIPQFHSFGFTVMTALPLTVGCRAVYATRFSPAGTLAMFREHRPTVYVGLPSMYAALMRAKSATPQDFQSLRLVISGGEPLSPAVHEGFLERFGVDICEGYGLTETAPVTNVRLPGDGGVGSVGRPVQGVDTAIIDPDSGQRVAPGAEGEIRLLGPNIFAGYYRDADSTAAAFDGEGYFRTGDIGRLDEKGMLRITGRLKEMLIVSGENVFPREIESALESHPSVVAAGVVGEPDTSRGEVPVAFVEIADGADFDAAQLRAWCRDRVAGHKVPKRVEQLQALPRNPVGKVLRRELKKLLKGSGE